MNIDEDVEQVCGEVWGKGGLGMVLEFVMLFVQLVM